MMLSMHPEALQRVREEHDRVFGPDAEAAVETLHTNPAKTNELEYTTAVIKETLRLFTVGFGIRSPPEGVYVPSPEPSLLVHAETLGEEYTALPAMLTCRADTRSSSRASPTPSTTR